ncbi:MAG: preprotein translocase subunit YajC [Alphaproteobacteria bacterium GM7ARS4]|nr:preprotein translocase subunit YajC [Alphaproteobacteria bacterium GM7ARS4]
MFAHANEQGGGRGGEPSALGLLLPFILIFAVFYFLVIRPQHTKMRRHAELIGSLKRGDTVVTSGGIIGEVSKLVGDDEVVIVIDKENNVRVRAVKATIADIRNKESTSSV